MNIILDRFPQDSLNIFIKNFKRKNLNPKIITFESQYQKNLFREKEINYYSDFEISNGFYFDNTKWVLNNKKTNILSRHESFFIKTLSRFLIDPRDWTSSEMSDHYYMLSNFWIQKIKKNKIECCFSFHMPHDPSSLSLYIVSKMLKVPYIFIDIVCAAGNLRFVSCSFSERNLLIRYPSEKTPKWVTSFLLKYLYNLQNNFSAAFPDYMRVCVENSKKTGYSIKNIQQLASRYILSQNHKVKDLVNKIFPKPRYLKIGRKKWYLQTSGIEARLLFLQKKLLAFLYLKFQKLKYDFYCKNKMCKTFRFKYIYFASPLEPEASTIPGAYNNSSIEIAIKRVLEIVSSDCRIVFKPSPFQFSTKIAFFSVINPWRRSSFYQDLARDARVVLASEKHNTQDLIDNSIGVVCINGTVAIEAAARGKNAITFAPMWYDSLENIHYCKNQKDIKRAYRLMEKKETKKILLKNFKFASGLVFLQKKYIDNNFTNKNILDVYRCLMNGLAVFRKAGTVKWKI